jgi:hypothetical protein
MENRGKGWMVVAIVSLALLAIAAVAIVFLALDRGEQGKDDQRIAELEQRLEELEQGRASQDSGPQAGGQNLPTDGEQIVAAMTYDYAHNALPGVNWQVGNIKIVGNWARASAYDPSHQYEGITVYYKKVNGQWTYVDAGTGYQYGDIPGAPPELFD